MFLTFGVQDLKTCFCLNITTSHIFILRDSEHTTQGKVHKVRSVDMCCLDLNCPEEIHLRDRNLEAIRVFKFLNSG